MPTSAPWPISRIGPWPASPWAACRPGRSPWPTSTSSPTSASSAAAASPRRTSPTWPPSSRRSRWCSSATAAVNLVAIAGAASAAIPRRILKRSKRQASTAYFYVSPDTAHEWQSWRRSLYQFAPLLFQDHPVQMAAAQITAATSAVTPAPAALRLPRSPSRPMSPAPGNPNSTRRSATRNTPSRSSRTARS